MNPIARGAPACAVCYQPECGCTEAEREAERLKLQRVDHFFAAAARKIETSSGDFTPAEYRAAETSPAKEEEP